MSAMCSQVCLPIPTLLPGINYPAIVETNDKKKDLATLIEKTRILSTQLNMLTGGGIYNRSLKRSMHALAIEILDSIPVLDTKGPSWSDGGKRRQPLDNNPLAYKTERFTLRTLSSLNLDELHKIHQKNLLTGYFRASRAEQIIENAIRMVDTYAGSTQWY